MEDIVPSLNRLMVDVFNDILAVEEISIKSGRFSDITVTELHTVETIGMYVKKTMTEVSKELNITMGTLTVAINNLVKKDYVERFKCEDDRRVVKIGLTKKGRLLYRAHMMFREKVTRASTSELTAEETNVLALALDKLHSFFTGYIGDR